MASLVALVWAPIISLTMRFGSLGTRKHIQFPLAEHAVRRRGLGANRASASDSSCCRAASEGFRSAPVQLGGCDPSRYKWETMIAANSKVRCSRQIPQYADLSGVTLERVRIGRLAGSGALGKMSVERTGSAPLHCPRCSLGPASLGTGGV